MTASCINDAFAHPLFGMMRCNAKQRVGAMSGQAELDPLMCAAE